jgi:hypothetical protein
MAANALFTSVSAFTSAAWRKLLVEFARHADRRTFRFAIHFPDQRRGEAAEQIERPWLAGDRR